MMYRVEVRGPWLDGEWRPAFPGPTTDPDRPRDFDVRDDADQAMREAQEAGGPFEFRVVSVDSRR